MAAIVNPSAPLLLALVYALLQHSLILLNHSIYSDPYVKVTLKRKSKSIITELTKKKKKVNINSYTETLQVMS